MRAIKIFATGLFAGLLAQLFATAVFAASLDEYPALGNATVQSSVRYATPQGEIFGGPPVNPPPTGPGTAELLTNPFDNSTGDATSFFGSAFTASFASASATLADLPFNPAGQGVGASAYTTYAFEVIGARAMTGSPALVDVTAHGEASSGATGYNADTTSNLPLGSSDPVGSFSAEIDPTLALDANDAPGLVLTISSQIQQPAVPEPASFWLLMEASVSGAFIVI